LYFLKAKQKPTHHPTFPHFYPKLARTKTSWILSMHLKVSRIEGPAAELLSVNDIRQALLSHVA